MGVSQLRSAMAWQRVTSVSEVKPWFLRDAPGFHSIPEMTPLPSEAVFDKIMMSAFEGTPLRMEVCTLEERRARVERMLNQLALSQE